MNKKGLAQIPLMIILLIIALVVPIATRLVQKNQDNRNFAVHSPTATPDPRQPCGSWRTDECSTGSCSYGRVCLNNHNVGGKCVCSATPTNDPRQPCGSWTTDECSTGSCSNGRVCINNHNVGGKCVCSVTPTAVPTSSSCYKDYSICLQSSECCSGICQGICKPKPTAVPTSSSCYKDYSICLQSSECCSGICQGICKPKPTNTPIPTATPTPIGNPIVPVVPTDTPIVGDQCPAREACPDQRNPNLLRNCHPADSDGTPNDTLCTATGMKEPCGNTQYCCPSPGGAWTTNMTNCPVPTTIPTAVPTTIPTAVPTSIPGWPVLNYKITYNGVKVHNDTKCAVNWPVQITVLSAGVTKVYTNVPSAISSSGALIEYKGSVSLEGFNYLTNVAAFIKGPKHMQMKYAIQNQSGRYNKAGGELVLTKSAETSVLYDFTAYSILPGDLVGSSIDDGPNGEINGVDFAYLKKLPKNDLGETGTNVKGDLDGNCMVNSNDIALFKISLQEKQGELY